MNRYKQIPAEKLESLNEGIGNVTLLPSSKNYNWKCRLKDELKQYINDDEVITVGRARNANTKYSKGLFIASQSHIIQSYNILKLNNKFLYYFIKEHEKEFYSSESTYPMFTKKDFEELILNYPLFKEQEKISTLFDKIDSIITLHQRKLIYIRRYNNEEKRKKYII